MIEECSEQDEISENEMLKQEKHRKKKLQG